MVHNIEAMQKRGLQAVKLTAGEKDSWRKTIEAIYPKVRGPIFPPDAFDAALRHRDQCRASCRQVSTSSARSIMKTSKSPKRLTVRPVRG